MLKLQTDISKAFLQKTSHQKKHFLEQNPIELSKTLFITVQT